MRRYERSKQIVSESCPQILTPVTDWDLELSCDAQTQALQLVQQSTLTD